MSFGVFNEGLRWIYRKAFANQYQSGTVSLGLYTNTRDTLTRRSVLADIVPCAGSGYAPITLSAAGWSITIDEGGLEADDVVLLDRANEIFTASASWGVVTGAYIFDPTNGIALMWRDLPVDYDMINGAKTLIDFLTEAS